jgi:hypothetical protein
MADYYDTQGRPIPMMVWAVLFEDCLRDDDERWWRIAQERVGDLEVSTVWLGLDHRIESGGPPLIFETMVFGGDLSCWPEQEEFAGIDCCERYSTWQQAEEGHRRKVAEVHAARELARK